MISEEEIIMAREEQRVAFDCLAVEEDAMIACQDEIDSLKDGSPNQVAARVRHAEQKKKTTEALRRLRRAEMRVGLIRDLLDLARI